MNYLMNMDYTAKITVAVYFQENRQEDKVSPVFFVEKQEKIILIYCHKFALTSAASGYIIANENYYHLRTILSN